MLQRCNIDTTSVGWTGGERRLPVAELVQGLRDLYPAERLFTEPARVAPYESDALTAFRQRPEAVVLPETRDEVIATVRACHRERVPFVARGSGTSLSGGSLPVAGGIVIGLNRLNRILRLDPVERVAVVEPGVINAHVTRAAAAHGLFYAPDPSSQSICTIGGNIAFNSGGAHCLKHGMTASHELDGERACVDADVARLAEVIRASGATEVRATEDAAERALIWKGRKSAFSAVGWLAPDYLVQDGCVPRTRLGAALEQIGRLAARAGLRVANVFHAGDGNLHPLILFDGREPGAVERAEELAGEILDLCIALGGSITGEHGIGVEKRDHLPRMFGPADLAAMRRVHRAVDPLELANRGKMFPTGTREASDPAVDDAIRALQDAVREHPRVLPRGGGSKPALSTPPEGVVPLVVSGLRGILEYDPEELTLTALAGTPVRVVQAALAAHGQHLPFDP